MKKSILLFIVAIGLSVFADEPQIRVSLSSQPSGATVIVDGRDRGVTPVMLFDIAPGRHHVKFRLAGYVERDRYFDTRDNPFVEKNEVMTEEKGLLLLKSEPAGANITIDGVACGQTPRLVTHLAAKDTYSVRLRKAGYQDLTLQVKFNGRVPLVREEKLVLASGRLQLMSEPSGARVQVNGVPRGVTPVTVSEVPKGRAVVKFQMDGFVEEVRELAINAGDEQTLPVVLKALPGTLHLSSVPEGARFYVNDEPKGKGPLALPGLKPGEYEIRAELEGYGTRTKTVTLANGASASEEFKLSNTMGRIELRTSPPGAAVILDGRAIGMTKAKDPSAEKSDVFTIENVLEGEHVITVRAEGYSEVVRHPKVKSGKTAKATITMKRIFLPDVEIVTARDTYRGVFVSRTAEYVTIEVSLGITRSFAVGEIRKLTFLKDLK